MDKCFMAVERYAIESKMIAARMIAAIIFAMQDRRLICFLAFCRVAIFERRAVASGLDFGVCNPIK